MSLLSDNRRIVWGPREVSLPFAVEKDKVGYQVIGVVPQGRDLGLDLASIESTKQANKQAINNDDLLEIATDHTQVDEAWGVSRARHVLANYIATRHVQAQRERITRL